MFVLKDYQTEKVTQSIIPPPTRQQFVCLSVCGKWAQVVSSGKQMMSAITMQESKVEF